MIVPFMKPLFAGNKSLYRPDCEPMEGGDVVLVAPGVIAAGSSPAGVARLARRVFDAGLAHYDPPPPGVLDDVEASDQIEGLPGPGELFDPARLHIEFAPLAKAPS